MCDIGKIQPYDNGVPGKLSLGKIQPYDNGVPGKLSLGLAPWLLVGLCTVLSS